MCYPLRTFVDIGFVVHVHVFNVHRGSIASRDYLKTGHDISQSSLCLSFFYVSVKLRVSSLDASNQLIVDLTLFNIYGMCSFVFASEFTVS